MKKGTLFILSAPGGTGKTTLANRLVNAFDDVVKSVSLTTRKKRPGEVCGIDYVFTDRALFEKKISEDAFIECSEVFGNWYGVEKSRVFAALNQGKHVILVIDVQGAIKVQEQLHVVSIFVSPPSIDELKRRLEDRGSGQAELEVRLKAAHSEMEMIHHYDHHVVNDCLEAATEELKTIFIQSGATPKGT